jgi:hypothetical protein
MILRHVSSFISSESEVHFNSVNPSLSLSCVYFLRISCIEIVATFFVPFIIHCVELFVTFSWSS